MLHGAQGSPPIIIRTTIRCVVGIFAILWFSSSYAQERFLTSPLEFGDSNFVFKYSQGAYTPGIMNSILDHSLISPNPNDPMSHWEYGKTSDTPRGGDGIVVAFNGETTNGPALSSDVTCISGNETPPIALRVIPLLPNTMDALVNGGGCGAAYASYDEHPGYDYKAGLGTPVLAAAPGWVVDVGGLPCIETTHPSSGNCSTRFQYIGIEHPNGYITQYGHLSVSKVVKGMPVYEGQMIGLAGDTGLDTPTKHPYHLHFEALKKLDDSYGYLIVDPYGWFGSQSDPLTTGLKADKRYANSKVTNTRLWADRCDRLTGDDDSSVPARFGVAHNVFSPLKEVNLLVGCNDTGITYTINNRPDLSPGPLWHHPEFSTQDLYIYQIAYEWKNGVWSQVTLTGTPSQYAGFFKNQAQGSGSRTLAELAQDNNVPVLANRLNNFVAYTCTIQSSQFRCGCRDAACSQSYWQLQQFQQIGQKRDLVTSY